MARVDGWQAALSRLVESRLHAPFAWGTNDCASFACDAILAVTGHDVRREVGLRWRDQVEAAHLLERFGGLHAAAAAAVQAPALAAVLEPVPVPRLTTGDVALVWGQQGATLMVCLGSRLASPGADGLMYRATGEALLGWHA